MTAAEEQKRKFEESLETDSSPTEMPAIRGRGIEDEGHDLGLGPPLHNLQMNGLHLGKTGGSDVSFFISHVCVCVVTGLLL